MRRSLRGFTLIELLAVVALVALVAAIALPRLGIGGDRRILAEAEQLAASLEFTRQRAAVTGVPHRLVMDLDRQAYRIEAWREAPPEPGSAAGSAGGETEPWHPADRDWADVRNLPMAAPREAARTWQPIPGGLGASTPIPVGMAILGVETPEGVADAGRVLLVFGADGSGDAARIELADEDGNPITLESAPLAHAVRLAWGGLRERAHGS